MLIAVGLGLLWRHGGSLRPGEPLSLAGLVLTASGAGLLLTRGGTSFGALAPGAVLGALLLIVGPWLWQLARERDAERTARIRSDERAEVAARVHDSVLQTLALVQRHADEPRRVASLARRQERELRSWLYGNGATPGETLEGALAAAADEIEELHGVRIELASGGDCALTDEVRAVVLAAREAMANAAKFSGADDDLGLRRGRRRAGQRVRPRPRRRLRPRGRARTTGAAWRSRSRAGWRARAARP